MPDVFYAITFLVIVLLAIGGVAASRAMARRARHQGHREDRSAREAPPEP
jgi:heme exporter protein D